MPGSISGQGVEVQFAALPELQKGGGGDGFGNRAEAKKSGGCCRSGIFEVGHAESCGPRRFPFQDDGGGDSWDAVGGHEARNGFLDFEALFLREGLLLGGNGRTTSEGYSQQANDARLKGASSGEWCGRIHRGTSGRESIANRLCPEWRSGGFLGRGERVTRLCGKR
jgi:hypothetical protein